MASRTTSRALLVVAAAAIGCAQGPSAGQPDSGTPGVGGTTPTTTGAGGMSAGATGGSGGISAPPGTGGTSAPPGMGGARVDASASDTGKPIDASGDLNNGVTDARVVDAARDAGTAAPDAGPRVDAGGGDVGSAMPTIWIAGDSTVMTYVAGNTDGNGGTSLEGWGQELAPFFNTRVIINNQAIGGRSVAFFMWAVQRDADGGLLCTDDQGDPLYQLDASGNHVDTSQWARIKSGIKAGDYLFIQFGTNDETHDCPRFVSLPDFETDFGLMADTVRAKGATPIFVTPMGHREFVGTTVNNTLLPYANAMKDEATQKAVEVLDLNLRSVEYYQMVGNTFLATNIFDTGTTHFIKAGAVEMASLLAGEIRRQGGALATLLK